MRAFFTKTLVAALGMTLLGACSTTYYRHGVEMTPEEAKQAEASQDSSSKDREDRLTTRVKAAVKRVGYAKGQTLLRELQWLISQGELAVPEVVATFPEADDRTQANLLYVLGFTRVEEATTLLENNLHNRNNRTRFEAAAGLLSHGQATAIPILVKFLKDDDKAFRFKAIEALRSQVGFDFDYNFAAPAELRNVAVKRWDSWWDSEKRRLMTEPSPGNN